MKMTFRWYGERDSIPLSYIRQIPGMTGVVTAVYDVPVGEVWHTDRIARLKALCDREQLEMEVIESVPVHEDIKLGRPTRDRLIENYAQTVRNLGKFGVKCVCYNFMPVFDWLRTNLHTPAPDGSNSLSYRHAELLALDPHDLHLPGWDESYTPAELRGLLDAYSDMTHEKLFENLVYFLRGILPACRDMLAIVEALADGGFDGYVRPDHGRNIWGEDGKPGYGLYDRALGACYLSGLFEAVEKSRKR